MPDAMTLPLAPFGPRTGLRGMVAAADQLAASAGLACSPAAARRPTPPWPPGPRWRSSARTCAGSAATSSPWWPRRARRPRRSCPSGGPVPGPTPAGLRGEGMTVDALARATSAACRCPGAVDGWLALHERHGRLPLDEVLAPAIELADEGFAASVMLALASHLVHALARCAASSAPTARSRSASACACPASPARCAPSRATGATPSTRGSSAAACSSWAAATSPRRTSRPARRPGARRCALPAWGHDLWTVPPPSQGYLTLAGAVGGRGGRARDRPGRSAVGPPARRVVARRRATTVPRCSSTVPTAPRCSTPSVWPPPRPGSTRTGGRHPTSRPGRDTMGSRRGPGRRRRHDPPVRARRGRARGLADAVQRARLRLAPDRARDRASSCTTAGVGFSLVAGPPGRGAHRDAGRRTPSPPCSPPAPDGALTHLVGAMGGDAQPQIIVQLLARLLRAGQDPATAVAAPRLTLDAPSAGPFRLWWGDDLTVLVEADAPRGLARRPDRHAATGCGPSAPSTRSPSGAPRSSRWSASADGCAATGRARRTPAARRVRRWAAKAFVDGVGPSAGAR